jgi:hypothetical protein
MNLGKKKIKMYNQFGKKRRLNKMEKVGRGERGSLIIKREYFNFTLILMKCNILIDCV